MKLAPKMLAVMLQALLLLLVVSSRGQAVAHASSSVDYARLQPAGGILLADRLPVVNAQADALVGGGSWTALSNMTQSVKQVNGGGYNQGVVYIPGGVINSTGPVLHGFMSYYTVATNRWRVDSQPMPVTVADAAICTDAAGKIHVINGFDSGSNLVSTHQVYDATAPFGTRWSTASAPVVSGNNYYSQGSGCVVINHVLYLFGGYGVIGAGTPAALGATWAYDNNTNSWSDTGFTLNNPRFWMGYGRKTNNGYVAGGTNDGGVTAMATTERFDPGTGWASGMNLPTALLAPGLVGTEAGVLVFGGGAPSGLSYALQSTTYLCVGSCGPAATWSDVNRYLITARWFAGWAGGPPDGPFIAGGINTVSGLGSLKTSERFQLPAQ